MAYRRLEQQEFGTVATADWATQVDTNFEYMWDDRPNVRLYKSTSTSVGSGAIISPTWTNARWNVGGMWTSGSNINIIRAGFYFVYCSLDWTASAQGSYRAMLLSDSYNYESTASTGNCSQAHSLVKYFWPGQVISLQVWHNGASSVTLSAGSASNMGSQDFGAVWLGGGDFDLRESI